MNGSSTRVIASLATVLAGPILGLGLLAACLAYLWNQLHVGLAYSMVTASLIHGGRLGGVLLGQLAAFAASVIIMHMALGLAAYLLARLTESAWGNRLGLRRGALVVLWFLIIAVLVVAANVTWYPASNFSKEATWLQMQWYGLRPIYIPLALAALFIAASSARAVAASRPAIRRPHLAAATAMAVGLAALAAPPGFTRSSQVAPGFESPHVVIIGIDSLRDDRVGGVDAESLTPQLDEFLGSAHRFSDAVTPLARTYAAWTSILTGRHPVTTNTRFNLMPRDLVDEGETLGQALQGAGYHTIYATDEVRFANFDESYGFDQLVGPPIGAIDFVLGKLGDLPLVNLVAPTPIGKRLFPSNVGNRAAYVTYRPEQFIDRMRDELVASQPTFLAVHLTLAHWPYSWADTPIPTTPQQYRPAYEKAVKAADAQFGKLLAVLREKGILQNAIVVVLSDHGEALGWESDTFLRNVGTGDEIWNSIWGHGTSVMSPHQFQVLLAMRGFGTARLPGDPGQRAWPVSLEDVRPTVQEFAIGQPAIDVDGVSLLPFLSNHADPKVLHDRIRYTETGWNPKLVLAGKYNESGLINEGAAYYELDERSGWMQLRRSRLDELIMRKQRAAMTSGMLLAAVPDPEDRSIAFWLTDRRAPSPHRITSRPDPAANPEATRLWDSLMTRFPGEISPPPPIPQS